MGLPQIGLLLLLLLLLGARGTTDLAPGAHHQLEKREGGPCVCVCEGARALSVILMARVVLCVDSQYGTSEDIRLLAYQALAWTSPDVCLEKGVRS
jgi:hypothetical protein